MALLANTMVYAAGAVVIAIAVSALTVLFLKFRKGSIEIKLDQRSVRPGDMLSGVLRIISKQDLLADRITVSVTCTEGWETEEWDHSANNGEGQMVTHRHSREAYYREHKIASDVRLAAKSRQDLPLQIEIPGHVGHHSVGIDFKWTLQARIHMKGLDLSTSQGIRVLYSYR
ncbi:MAG: hypothetical protein VX346_25615 [Planctomycetota bacterium]|nr:hypothetical protein [Planctomycetota bacterium]